MGDLLFFPGRVPAAVTNSADKSHWDNHDYDCDFFLALEEGGIRSRCVAIVLMGCYLVVIMMNKRCVGDRLAFFGGRPDKSILFISSLFGIENYPGIKLTIFC